MSSVLNLCFELNTDKLTRSKYIYHEAPDGSRTPKFDLDAILGNDDGNFEWGWNGWPLSAENERIEAGHILRANLRQLNKEMVPKEIDLSQHVRLSGNKLEAYDLPKISQEAAKQLAIAILQETEKLVAIAVEAENERRKKADEQVKKEREELRKRVRETNETEGDNPAEKRDVENAAKAAETDRPNAEAEKAEAKEVETTQVGGELDDQLAAPPWMLEDEVNIISVREAIPLKVYPSGEKWQDKRPTIRPLEYQILSPLAMAGALLMAVL